MSALAGAPGLDGRAAPASVIVMFGVNGLVIGGYGGLIPALRDKLHLAPTQIALLLFCGGLAGIAGMQLSGRLADRRGAKRTTLLFFPLMVVAPLLVALAPTLGWTIAAALVLGLGNGGMDVAMNALGVQVEAARQRPIMGLFHAVWSMGNAAGAGLVLLVALVGRLPAPALLLPVALIELLIGAITVAVLWRIAPESTPVEHHNEHGSRAKIPPAAWLLGVMAIGFGLGDGTAMDWSSLHVIDVSGVSPAMGALGLGTVSVCMVIVRLAGDRLVARFGRRRVVRAGAVCAAVGYAITALVTPLPLVLLGWALAGLGAGIIAPLVYAVAGHMGGGRVLAVVVTFGYATFLAGPALTGLLVKHLGIQHAMFVPGAFMLLLVALAVTMPAEDADLATPAS